jgi:hypothetical protein
MTILLAFGACGCASVPPLPDNAPADQEVTNLLSQAASQLQSPDGPVSLNVMDVIKSEWRTDKSMKISVHQIWATRVKPGRNLPPLVTLNKDSQTLTLQDLQLYDLNQDGTFSKSSAPVSLDWTSPEANLSPALTKIATAHLPEMNAGQALEIRYTLETKTSILLDKDKLKEGVKFHPVPAEASFAFRWNDYTPSLKRDLMVQIPKDIPLYAVKLRLPKGLAIDEDKLSKVRSIHFSLDNAEDPVPAESFQPALQDLVPITAFTLSKSWEEAVFPYRKRVKQLLDEDLGPIHELLGEAEGNTALPLADRLAQAKSIIHQKVEWVDTGLPVYLNPDRTFRDIIDSGKGTSHDMAILLAAALKAMKINAQIYLYRQATSGDLIGDLPALSQLDGVLLAVPSGKDWVWMDPTEPLAVPGALPLYALGQQALAVYLPLNWKPTPSFNAKDHRKERDVIMQLSPDGSVKCTVNLLAFGAADLSLRQFFRMTTDEKRKELVLRGLAKRFPGVTLNDYSYGDYRDINKPLDLHYTFTVPNYAEFQAKGGFQFYPLVFEDVEDFLANLKDSRQTPVVIPQNFNSVTRVVVKLPAGYKIQDLPKDGSMSNSVADFVANSKVQFGTLTYDRYLGLKQRSILPGREYEELLGFYQAVLNQDRTPFIAVKSK